MIYVISRKYLDKHAAKLVAPNEYVFIDGENMGSNASNNEDPISQKYNKVIIRGGFCPERETISLFNKKNNGKDVSDKKIRRQLKELYKSRDFLASCIVAMKAQGIYGVDNDINVFICLPTLIYKFIGEEIAAIIKQYNKEHDRQILYHVDAIQAFGKRVIYPKRVGIDAMSMSGHKIHGPKGSGAVFVDSTVKIKPVLYGGGQEKGMRSGTENTAAIAGMGKATEIMYARLEENNEKMQAVKDALIAGATKIEGVTDNSGESPHIASLSFRGVRSEVLLHALEDKGIYVSAGSACSSNHPAISGVLQAIGLDKDLLESTLRFSFCEYNTVEEAEYTVKVLEEILQLLRNFTIK